MKKNNFRIWDKQNKKWLKADEHNGLYYCLSLTQDADNKVIEIRDYDLLDGTIDVMDELEDVVIMQSTGLKDKNGTMIYEGDILKSIDGLRQVFWNEDSASLMTYNKKGDYAYLFKNQVEKWYEVAGNICQNDFEWTKRC